LTRTRHWGLISLMGKTLYRSSSVMDITPIKKNASTLTREDLRDALRKNVPILSLGEARRLVDEIFKEIISGLNDDGKVQLSSFGSFFIRNKSQRIGRNPKNGVEAVITARRSVFFKPSPLLKTKVND
jgi:integration host factor subunit alpha